MAFDYTVWRKAYEHRPDVVAKRLARYKKYRSDPVKVRQHRQRVKLWTVGNKNKVRLRMRRYIRIRRNTNPQANIANRLRSRFRHALAGMGAIKSASTETLLGCSIPEFLKILESKFMDGMTWQNVMAGQIHIDHTIPCAEFDLTDPDQQKRCFHYTNLQPLWKVDNLSKGSKRICEPAL